MEVVTTSVVLGTKLYFSGYTQTCGVETKSLNGLAKVTENDLRKSCATVKPLSCKISPNSEGFALTRDNCLYYTLDENLYQLNINDRQSGKQVEVLDNEKVEHLFSSATSAQLVCSSDHKEYILLTWILDSGVKKKLHLPKPCQLQNVALGDRISVILEDGKLKKIWFGLQDQEVTMIPLHISSPNRVISVDCGAEHVVALTCENQVFTCGNGSRGQLGLDTILTAETLTQVEALYPVKISAVATGGWHTIVLSESGDIYAWGWNESGQVGGLDNPADPDLDASHTTDTEVRTKLYFLPTLVDTPLSEVFQGIGAGFRHSAAVTKNGDLFTWGWNAYGQLCQGDQIDRVKPCLVTFFKLKKMKVVDVICGGWTTLVKTNASEDCTDTSCLGVR